MILSIPGGKTYQSDQGLNKSEQCSAQPQACPVQGVGAFDVTGTIRRQSRQNVHVQVVPSCPYLYYRDKLVLHTTSKKMSNNSISCEVILQTSVDLQKFNASDFVHQTGSVLCPLV